MPTNLVASIDLTLEISRDLPSFPGSPRPQFISWADKKSEGYNLELIFLSSHSGTHLDAPYHFIEKGLRVDKIPLSRLVVDALLCRIRKGPDEPITRKDLALFEGKNGRIPPNSTIIFETDWSRNLTRADYFTRNPGLSETAAEYLLSKKPNMIGIDSPSIDLGKDREFPAHHKLLKGGVLVLENLCNLGKIKRTTFRLVVLPLKLKGATGSPVRAIAI